MTIEAAVDTAIVPVSRAPNMRSVIFGAGIGNALEWYDFAAYAIFAPFFAPQFFNPQDKTAALLATLAIFAVGFLLRPLGGFYFGWLADRRGRRHAMIVSMSVTAVGCLVIGLSPTYATIGIAAPTLLVLGRLAQGFGLGGEIGASFTFLIESAPPERRGLWSSSMFICLIMGSLLATIIALVLTAVLPEGAMAAYGWRIPFLIGALLGVYAIFLRRGLDEPDAFKAEQAYDATHRNRQPVWRTMWDCRGAIVTVVGLTAGPTLSYNTWVSGATTYAINFKHMDAKSALWSLLIGCIVYIIAQPIWGMISDKGGRKPNLLIGAVMAVLLAVPLVGLIQGAFVELTAAISISLFFLAAWTAIAPAVYAELFPTRIRATGMAIPYSLTVALFGGTAPYIQNWLASIERMDIFSFYLIALNLLTAVTIWWMPETRGRPLA
ncbi:MFS transporter [Bradyrhizobium sp. NP1]|jgi:MHS family alpha-ketoglutarate permease-like MFS transporter|uniref:MFS transporter n=1 Tax=Bradyrhizobium sp. NP1 TaxID=3049772 RepID=UPI0025A625E6|nr:MFS transporter [Bradyrhizobium sp. NP1]WJR78216.1 MFS transporter [Bradyrhizobium sp. NP1]